MGNAVPMPQHLPVMPSNSSQSNSTSNPYSPTSSQSTPSGQGPSLRSMEWSCVGWAAAWFFFVLLSYFMVRPVRETMGAIGGTRQLQWLMAVTFLTMLIAVPVYSALVARLSRRWLVRVVFHFFCVCLMGFAILMRSPSDLIQVWTARTFFIWVNLFALFSTSVFWSVLADLFGSEQGKRLFGKIAAGGTVGAIAGSFLTSQIATQLSTGSLLLLPVVGLQLGLWCAWRLEKMAVRLSEAIEKISDGENTTNVAQKSKRASAKMSSGGLTAGITRVMKSPYLASICLFLLFVQGFGTQLYFQQAEIVADQIPNDAAKTQLFAYLDLGTQLLSLTLQTLVSAPLLRRWGVSIALILLPLAYAISFFGLANFPVLPVLIAAVITCRGFAYGIIVPAREVLFTVVDREDKYKSKSFIDTVVLRGGDAASGQLIGVLRNDWGLGMSVLNLCALPVLAFWGWSAYRLGRRQREKAAALQS